MIHVESDDDKRDRYNLSLILFYCLGMLTQLSNSFFPTAHIYWDYKFRDVNKPWDPASNTTTELQDEFTADFSLVAGATLILGLIIAAIFTRKLNIIHRMVGSFCGLIGVFLLVILFVVINTDSWQKGFFYLTLFLIFLVTGASSIYLITLFQFCSKFPTQFLTAILSGTAICGIFSASAQILTLLIDGSPQTNGILYFSVAVFCVTAALLSFLLSVKFSPFFHYHLFHENPAERNVNITINKQVVVEIIKRQKLNFGSMLIITGVTMAIHPSLTSTIRSIGAGNDKRWNDVFFVPVITYFTYNVVDLLGRELALKIRKPTGDIPIFCLSMLRIVFIPLILMCNLSAKHHTGVVFKSDAVYITLMVLFAITNGYATNICVVNIPRNMKDLPGERAVTIGLIIGILIIGAALFLCMGLIIVKLL